VPTVSVLVLGDLHEIFVVEFQRSVKADIDANGHFHNIRAWSPKVVCWPTSSFVQ
jgi:hypothetical protein